ncbi:wHTH domain-containing protein [Streptomyces asiaticus]|uniref:wHTH domain-containing protein n=1 Tax=Streptomyces asiaticus TaxID=114695 RepID=UPI00380C54C4
MANATETIIRIQIGRDVSWIEPGRRVPYGHVLYAAATLGRGPAAVVSELTGLGFADIELPVIPLPDAVAPDDVLLLKADTYNVSWLEVGTPVPLRHLLAAAGRQALSPAEAARRLTAFGWTVPATQPLPETPDTRDIVLIRTDPRGDGEWLEWGDEVSTGHVHKVATTLRCNPHTVATRLLALGIRLPYTPEPEDERILQDPDGSLGHVLTVAQEMGRRPADIVARLAELGHDRPSAVPDPPDPDDLRILSEELDGQPPWLERNNVVGVRLRHILRAAVATGRGPADIAERLDALGHWLHQNAKLPAVADVADIRLLETVDRSFLDGVHLEHVLRSASLTGRSPADVASRLTALGYRLPDEVDYPEVCGALRG